VAEDARAAVLTVLYREHALGLTRLAYVMLGNRAAAEDVVHEAFLGLHRRWQQLSQPQKPLPYLRSSVLNGCRSVHRAAARPLRATHEPPAASAESIVLTEEEHRQVMVAVRRLPRRQREVVVLRYYLGLSDTEIAGDMGISPGTVRSAAHRALGALGVELKETS
jgi:RNA polymerase sigma-70 factor (sigma-E family)